jgi:hypothetical protein
MARGHKDDYTYITCRQGAVSLISERPRAVLALSVNWWFASKPSTAGWVQHPLASNSNIADIGRTIKHESFQNEGQAIVAADVLFSR